MKILYLSNLYYPQAVGGAEKIAQWLAEAMAARGHEVSVLTLCERRNARTEWVNGVKVRYVPIRNVYLYQPAKTRPTALRILWHLVDVFNLRAGRQIGRVIDEEAPDLVHTHNLTGFSAAVWPQARLRRLPCVHTIHDYYLLCCKSTLLRRGRHCQRRCAACFFLSLPRRHAAGCLSAAVGVSRSVLEAHRAVLKDVPIIRVIHNGLAGGGDGFEGKSTGAAPIRLGYLGRLEEAKGIEVLLSEFHRFHEGNECELIIGGTGRDEYVRSLRGRYENSRVSFLGFVNPNWFMGQIDLLVVPSVFNDPFPTVVLEALAKGVAVVGARRGGIPELIRDGENGETFEPTMPGDLGRALKEAVRAGLVRADSRPRTANSVAHLTLANMCDRYEQVYREAQANRKGIPMSHLVN